MAGTRGNERNEATVGGILANTVGGALANVTAHREHDGTNKQTFQWRDANSNSISYTNTNTDTDTQRDCCA